MSLTRRYSSIDKYPLDAANAGSGRVRKVSRPLVLLSGALLIAILIVPQIYAAAPVIGVPRNLAVLPPFPEGLAVGPDGNLYAAMVGFSSSSSIIVVSRTGEVVREIAVSAGPGANQTNLLGEIFDEAGNLYVCDAADVFSGGTDGRVLKIAPDGSMTTVASGLSLPNGLALDGSGNLYVSDTFQAKIWKISPTGSVSLFSDSDLLRAHGSITGLPPAGVNGIAFTRAYRALLAVNTVDGTLIEIPLLSNGTAGPASVMSNDVLGADGIALDVMGNIYIALVPFNKIALLNPAGVRISTIEGTGENAFRSPASLAFRGRALYITDFTFFSGGTPGISVMTALYPGAPVA